LTPRNTINPTDLLSFFSTIFQNLPGILGCKKLPGILYLISSPKCPGFSTIRGYAPNVALSNSFFLYFNTNLLVKRVFLLKATFAAAKIDLISRVHLA